jgi:hypothetical protein
MVAGGGGGLVFPIISKAGWLAGWLAGLLTVHQKAIRADALDGVADKGSTVGITGNENARLALFQL